MKTLTQNFMKPIFSRNPSIDRISFLNWRIGSPAFDNLAVIAEGYFLSATELIGNCLLDNTDKRADVLIFPILTNANHGIELYLKGTTWMFNSLLKNDKRAEGGHNIKQIYETLISKIKKYDIEVSRHFVKSTQGLRHYLEELYDRISASSSKDRLDFSRYPFDKDYGDHFYAKNGDQTEIDLDNLLKRLTEIHAQLEEFYTYVYYDFYEYREDY